jgi:hypothetical protein
MDCIALASFAHTQVTLQELATATGLKTAILRKSPIQAWLSSHNSHGQNIFWQIAIGKIAV